MMGNVSATVLSVVGAVIGLAIVAVLVSQKAQTSQVLQGAGSALSGVIAAAVGPVTGSGTNSFGSPGSNPAGASH
jgi:PRD1 phage membrane DNA delivery